MNLDQKATEDLVKMAVWSQDSLGYAHKNGQRKLIWLLEAIKVEVKLEEVLLTLGSGEHLGSERGTSSGKGQARQKGHRGTDMAVDVLAHQAGVRARRTREPFEEALKGFLETKAGRELGELRDGPHRNEEADQWQEDLAQQRAQERKREQAEERSRVQQAATWERFVQAELRELDLRKGGQLARLLSEPLPGEPPAALERLASEDRRQAEEGLVALMRNGNVFYKHLEELSQEDMPARIAANRARTTWLKERQDRWLSRGDGS